MPFPPLVMGPQRASQDLWVCRPSQERPAQQSGWQSGLSTLSTIEMSSSLFIFLFCRQVHLPFGFVHLDWILAYKHNVSIMPGILGQFRWVCWRHLSKWLWKPLKKVNHVAFSLWTPVVQVSSFSFLFFCFLNIHSWSYLGSSLYLELVALCF